MTSFVLKMIAIITMCTDHLGNAIFKNISVMNLIGRISFPIFAFQISEGYSHTKSLKKYFSRLILFALISQVPFMLFLSVYSEAFYLNIFFTLALGLVSIFIYDKIVDTRFALYKNEKINSIFKKSFGIFIVVLLGIISEVCKFDYGFFGIAIIFLFHFFRNDKIGIIISFMTACIIKYGIDIIQYGYSIWYILLCIFTILPILLISLYNGKQGKKVKYLLYLFYPVHLAIIYFIFH